MFSLSELSFGQPTSAYKDYLDNHLNKLNGMSLMIMQSAENADKVISDFEEAIARGLNPNSVIDDVLAKRGLSESDFTDEDILRINRRVEAIYRTMNNSNHKRGY